jgi:RNA polymerase sigma factor (sigma-70 family)
MDDSEVVAAIKAGDPAGLAAAYDTYAARLYGYCRWILREPAPAADALLETFAIAADHLGDLRDASQLRVWLYSTARDECYRRVSTAGPGFDETADEISQAADSGRRAEQAEVRRLIRETLAELKPHEHEVIELSVRHSLDEAEVAAVLDVSWSRAHALASRAREHLGKTLDALLIARTRRKSCPVLGALLTDWNGWLTAQTRKLTALHIEHCETCASHRHGALRPEMLSSLLPLAALPPGLREPVLRHAAAGSAETARRQLIGQAGTREVTGFRRAGTFLGWSRIRANPGAATAVAAVTLWIVAAMSATMITITGAHAARALAAQTHSAPAPASAPASTPAASSQPPATARPRRSPSPKPTTQLAPRLVPTFAPTWSASPTPSAKPTPSKSASHSASASASSSPSPSPTPTHSSTATPTPTPTPTTTTP